MLNLQAVFERKTNEFSVRDCVIDKIVELTEEKYQNFQRYMLRDTGFIMENRHLMYEDENNVHHCLLVLGQNGTEGVLIQCEGYDYAKYACLLPGARDFVGARLNELADHMIKEGTQNTESGIWAVSFDEIKEQYKVTLDSANGISEILLDILGARPEMAEVEPREDGYDMIFYLDYCPNIDEKEKLSSEIPDNVFRIQDLIRVPMENFYLVHCEVDLEVATIVLLDSGTLTDQEKEEWSDVLNAQVVRVFHDIYGIQAECAGVPPQRLVDFSLMLAGYCPCEGYKRRVKDVPDEPSMKLSL